MRHSTPRLAELERLIKHHRRFKKSECPHTDNAEVMELQLLIERNREKQGIVPPDGKPDLPIIPPKKTK